MTAAHSTADLHRDVLIVGAGISGISAAWHLQTNNPDRTFALLDGRADLGGTWDLFRYPGVRSDSDMHTLGFSFNPWTSAKAIADGPAILKYVRETAQKFGIDAKMRFGHMVRSASWDTANSTWTLTVERISESGTPEVVNMTCGFLLMCSGYYSYQKGHTPDFAGSEDFTGPIIHPQHWPEDLDYTGKRVAVIGSGATAMTLVPAMAESAEHVTMVQRTPTWVVSRPDEDPIANGMRKVLPDAVAYNLTRRRNTFLQGFFYRQTRTAPGKARARLLKEIRKSLPEDVIDEHFTPSYAPWDQRLCLIPNGDLYSAINSGKASVRTDTIQRFTPDGIRLTGGEEVEADIIITATGLELVTLGNVAFTVDDTPVDFASTWTYKGLAYSDVPNLVSTFGYINASWTLRADLTSDYVSRLLNFMTETGTTQATPRLRPSDRGMPVYPLIRDFPAGYMKRGMPKLPRQSDREPWVNLQSFARERKLIGEASVDDGVMTFTKALQPATGGS